MRCAARPVGAASSTRLPRLCNILMIALSVVVLPVPGPPVSTSSPSDSAAVIASFCKSAYRI